jgi:hypothetical protein
MIGGTEIELCPMKAKEFLPKNSSEYWIPVTNNRGRNAM